MSDKQNVEKITITREERGWQVAVKWEPEFGHSGHLLPTHKTLREALKHIKETLPLDE